MRYSSDLLNGQPYHPRINSRQKVAASIGAGLGEGRRGWLFPVWAARSAQRYYVPVGPFLQLALGTTIPGAPVTKQAALPTLGNALKAGPAKLVKKEIQLATGRKERCSPICVRCRHHRGNLPYRQGAEHLQQRLWRYGY
jgi:hypothetical protein